MNNLRQSKKDKAASAFLKERNYAVFLTRSLTNAKLINHTSLLIHKVTHSTASLITNFKHHWHYRMFALLRTQLGEQYIVISDQPIFTIEGQKGLPFKQLEVAKELDRAHKKFLTTVNGYHLLNTGWLAFPYHHYFTEDELIEKIDSLCDMYECWNFNTFYEQEMQESKQKSIKS